MAGQHHEFSVAQVAASVRLDMGTYIAVGITLFCGFLLNQRSVQYRLVNSLMAIGRSSCATRFLESELV